MTADAYYCPLSPTTAAATTTQQQQQQQQIAGGRWWWCVAKSREYACVRARAPPALSILGGGLPAPGNAIAAVTVVVQRGHAASRAWCSLLLLQVGGACT